jgi:hypothetical protein
VVKKKINAFKRKVQRRLGYRGLLKIFLCSRILKVSFRIPKCRVINPVVVAPTVAAVGLAFFAYGFPVVGRCVEIGIPQILLLVLFALVSW